MNKSAGRARSSEGAGARGGRNGRRVLAAFFVAAVAAARLLVRLYYLLFA